MKVSLNSKFFEGPFGGGVQFAKTLKKYLIKRNVKVTNQLVDNDIDIILHINPLPFLTKASSYSFIDAYLYKLNHPETVIIQRINECDERKGTSFINNMIISVCQYSDYVVFISKWLKNLFDIHGLREKDKSIRMILNGADTTIFNQINKESWDKSSKLKIVTHHWSPNPLKGHDVYQKFDKLLNDKKMNEKYEFTFIGNCPKNLTYKSLKILKPINGIELANELKKHNVYLTASINEPAGMHHIEGALCGLPLLYRNSGALPEYCSDYGIGFDEINFEEKLEEMYVNFDIWSEIIKTYPNTAENMSNEYIDLFFSLYERRAEFSLHKSKLRRAYLYSHLKLFYFYFSTLGRLKRFYETKTE